MKRLDDFLVGHTTTAEGTWVREPIFGIAIAPEGSMAPAMAAIRPSVPWVDTWAKQNLKCQRKWLATDWDQNVTAFSMCISRDGILRPHEMANIAEQGMGEWQPLPYNVYFQGRGLGMSAVSRRIGFKANYWPNGSFMSWAADPATYQLEAYVRTLFGVTLGTVVTNDEQTFSNWNLDSSTGETVKESYNTVAIGSPSFPAKPDVLCGPSLVERLEVHHIGNRTIAFNLVTWATFADYLENVADKATGNIAEFRSKIASLRQYPKRCFGLWYNDGGNPFDLYPPDNPLRKNSIAIWSQRGVVEGIDLDKLHERFDATIGTMVPFIVNDEDGTYEDAPFDRQSVTITYQGGAYHCDAPAAAGIPATSETLEALYPSLRAFFLGGGGIIDGSLPADVIVQIYDNVLSEPRCLGLNDELMGFTEIVRGFIGALLKKPDPSADKLILSVMGPTIISN